MDFEATQIRATLGFADAQVSLGVMYYDGIGVPCDRARAMRLFKRAADQGDAQAAWTLARAEQAAPRASMGVETEEAPMTGAAAPPVTREEKTPAPRLERMVMASVERAAPAAAALAPHSSVALQEAAAGAPAWET